jgi:hypothetical protein
MVAFGPLVVLARLGLGIAITGVSVEARLRFLCKLALVAAVVVGGRSSSGERRNARISQRRNSSMSIISASQAHCLDDQAQRLS